ncbi:MAG: hypothetical protein K9I94_15540 [Bacteroidales bacterium]|nr:hypothetical protein [Bacteroidales bacterium]
MKTLINYIAIAFITLMLTFSSANVMADGPAPPPPDHGTTGNTSGTTAPIGGGLFILMGLGAAYGAKKLYDARKKKLME